MRVLAAIGILFVASACVANKYTPALDSALTEAGASLLATMELVVEEPANVWERVDGLPEGGPSGVGSVMTIQHNRTTSSSRWHLEMLYLLTLGIVPDGSDVTYALAGDVRLADTKTPFQFEYSEASVSGWAALFLLVRPGWEWGTCLPGQKLPVSTRAFYTVINRMAEEEINAKPDAREQALR